MPWLINVGWLVGWSDSELHDITPNLRSGVPIFFIRGGKVRLIQLLDYLSVASPESGLFSDWSRNKRYLEQNEISVSLACY